MYERFSIKPGRNSKDIMLQKIQWAVFFSKKRSNFLKTVKAVIL